MCFIELDVWLQNLHIFIVWPFRKCSRVAFVWASLKRVNIFRVFIFAAAGKIILRPLGLIFWNEYESQIVLCFSRRYFFINIPLIVCVEVGWFIVLFAISSYNWLPVMPTLPGTHIIQILLEYCINLSLILLVRILLVVMLRILCRVERLSLHIAY